ncbi:MAG: bifunctional phosphoribosylaminoimidazolecarboxamide formyltransferase/IMP cyclohydrolase, partial [Myxococcales bacterium]|nr:bifunctional phosphoribosylaminoimidazolecarboxamide formyltransferase/IMP cyclohydrolase [Myxococcales bacterium]
MTPRALISVSDKSGVVDFAIRLVTLGFEIISTGGTLRELAEAGVPVTPVAEITGFPEAFGGRVKTLHPLIHGGILFRRSNDSDVQEAAELNVAPIDLVCVNLYPFEQTVAQDGVTESEAVEQIDIGGPTMVRAAAKSFADVVVVVDPSDYLRVADSLDREVVDLDFRRELAIKAFEHTANYDAAITRYFRGAQNDTPAWLRMPSTEGEPEILRYGENP